MSGGPPRRAGITSARSKANADPRTKPRRAGEASLFGATLKEYRVRAGLTLKELSEKANLSSSHLSNIENGFRRTGREVAAALDAFFEADGELIEAFNMDNGAVRPRELPSAPSLLIGRQHHLHSLTETASGKAKREPERDHDHEHDHEHDRGHERRSGTPAIVVIEGPAGVGKSALAIRWAHDVADEFIAGQLYADLRGAVDDAPPAKPEEILDAFCATLSPGTPMPQDLDAKSRMFRSLVANRRILIVLDNAATDAQVEPLLPGTAGCSVVITSRRHLLRLHTHRSARQIRVSPLNHEDAQALINAAIGRERGAAESQAVAELAHLCGGLPLALKVAAHLLSTRPERPVSSLVAEIEEDGGPLVALDTDDLHSPRRAIDRTYRELEPAAARGYRLLALHPGPPIAIAAVAALWNRTSRESRQLLRQLTAVNLIEMTHDSTHADAVLIHELTRDHAHDLLDQHRSRRDGRDDPDDPRDAAHRLILWYLHTARAALQVLAPDHTPPDLPAIDDTTLQALNPRVFATDTQAYAWCETYLRTLIALGDIAAEHDASRSLRPLVTATVDLLVGRADESTMDHRMLARHLLRPVHTPKATRFDTHDDHPTADMTRTTGAVADPDT